MKKIGLLLTLITSLLVTLPVFSFNLKEARKSGAVKELSTGYLRATKTSLKKTVDGINKKRKAHYEAVAKKTGTPVAEVAKIAAEKIKAKSAGKPKAK